MDVAGQVLGLNTSALLRGISVAVPVPTLNRVVEALLAEGRVRRGYLGVGLQPVRLPATQAQGLSQETGLLIVSVESEGPGGKHGLLLGDAVVSLGGEPVRHLDDLMALLSGDRVGVRVPVRVVRGGTLQELSVVVGERP